MAARAPTSTDPLLLSSGQPANSAQPAALGTSSSNPVTVTNNSDEPRWNTPRQRQKRRRRRRRYRLRSALNILGSIAFTAFYALIIWYYVDIPVQNGVAENRTLDPKFIYYFWFILSVFALDWAHSGTAVIEIAAVISKHLAPKTAMQTMWHSERSWGGPTGWMKAVVTVIYRSVGQLRKSHDTARENSPATLWWLLTLINVPIWIAVPLSGLSFDFNKAATSSSHPVVITGVNQSSFETRSSSFLWQSAVERWSQGGVTNPQGPGVLYAPESVTNLGNTYYNDIIQNINFSDSVTFFSGPSVEERAEGRTWGLHVRVNVRPVLPEDLTMINAQSFKNWTSTASAVSTKHVVFEPVYGCGGALVVASNGSGTPAYMAGKGWAETWDQEYLTEQFFVNTLVEMVLWQYYPEDLGIDTGADASMQKLMQSPYVRTEPLSDADEQSSAEFPETFLLRYGLAMDVQSAVGFADVSAKTSTYSNFTTALSLGIHDWESLLQYFTGRNHLVNSCLNLFPGTPKSQFNRSQLNLYNDCQESIQMDNMFMERIQAIVDPMLSGGEGFILGLGDMLLGALTCYDFGPGDIQSQFLTTSPSSTCQNTWLAASKAIGTKPHLLNVSVVTGVKPGEIEYTPITIPYLQLPMIDPMGMRLAIFKLVGELAIAMTGPGAESYTGTLTGLSEVTILCSGILPWQLILMLLMTWTVLFVSATCLFFWDERYVPTLGAFQFFRFGAEWRDELYDEPMVAEFTHSYSLSQIPSVAERKYHASTGPYGFVGLSLRKLQNSQTRRLLN